jgi:hypothetical protein
VPYFVTEASSCRHSHCHCRCSPLATRHHHNHGRPVASSSSSLSSSYHHRHCHHHRLPPLVVSTPLYCCALLLLLHTFHHHLPSHPPSFVDCCFKRQTKPLMVLSLSSRPSALVGCFHCPPPAHSRRFPWHRRQQSVSLTAGASTLPLPCPPLIVATPSAVLPLCAVFQTLAAQLAAWSYSWVRDNA